MPPCLADIGMTETPAQRRQMEAKATASEGLRLEDLRPDLAERALANLTRPNVEPRLLSLRSNQMVLWSCQCGASFPRNVNNMTKTDVTVCRSCRRVGKSCFEFEVAELLRSMLGTGVALHHVTPAGEVDLFLTGLGIGVELDPYSSHRDKAAIDARRLREYLSAEVEVFRVRERPLDPIADSPMVDRKAPAYCWAQAIVGHVSADWRELDDIEIKNALRRATLAWQSVLTTPPSPAIADLPSVADEFAANLTHPGRTPEWTAAGGADNCLWRCVAQGHEWEAPAYRRSGPSGSKCSKCRYALQATEGATAPPAQSVATVAPLLCEEFIRNIDRPGAAPETMYPQSQDRCEWRCSNCHKLWIAPMQARYLNNHTRCFPCNRKVGSAKRRNNPDTEESAKWERRFAMLAAYAAREKHAAVPYSHVEESFALGEWVHKQRQNRDRHVVLRVAALEALPGWIWHKGDAAWEEGWQWLQVFVERDGHASVKFRHIEGMYPLGRWVVHQRQQFSKGRLSRERIARLEGVPGWQWWLRRTTPTRPEV